MRQKAFRSFPNRYPFSLYYEVISSFSIRYNLEIILQCKSNAFLRFIQVYIGYLSPNKSFYMKLAA